MTFEEFEKASSQELKAEAKSCFDLANNAALHDGLQIAKLLEAQLYITELDRRVGGRIALRDLLLEIVVILLIGGEILLAVRQGKDEDVLMDKQNAILTSLQQSTSDTAITMKGLAETTKTMNESASATAGSLHSVQSTITTMNKGVHDQISLFYDPSIAISYDMGQNQIHFMNTGRAGLTLITLKLDGTVKNLGGNKLIAAGTTFYANVPDLYNEVAAQLQKGSVRMVPVEAHLENEVGKKFMLTGVLFCLWENDKVVVHGQSNSVQPEE